MQWGVLDVSRVEKGALLYYQLRELEQLLDSENNLHTHFKKAVAESEEPGSFPLTYGFWQALVLVWFLNRVNLDYFWHQFQF